MARPLLGWGPEDFEPAFESHVDPSFFRTESQLYDRTTNFKHFVTAFDDPHNKVVGELATKGALGAIAYLVLWGVMVWAILGRRRSPREEVLAYVVLGALSGVFIQTGIPQIKPTFLDMAPAGIPPNIIPHSKGVKCGLIHSKSPLSLGNHCTAKRKSPKPLVYAQVSPLGSSFALCDPVTVTNPDAPKVD